MPKISLLDICLDATSSFLIECFWPVGLYYCSDPEDEFNPFIALPSEIIEELISRVILKVPSGNLNVRHLYHLLSTGRVINFIFENFVISAQDFIEVLTALSVHAYKLKKFVLRQVFCSSVDGKFTEMNSTAIGCLLAMSPNLEYIEVDKPFDFKSLHPLRSLKHLEMKFATKQKLFRLMPKIDDYTYVPFEDLTFISIYEDYLHKISVEEMAFVLQHCPKLVTIENNIAHALELLHGEELNCGLLTKRYNLQSYVLGSGNVSRQQASVTAACVQIAAVTCPDTRHIDALVSDHQTLPAFADFKKLDSFLIQWEDTKPGDYRLGLFFALRDIGAQLQELYIHNFKLLDFAEIGRFCPSLKTLKVEYDNEVTAGTSSIALFTHLEKLFLQCDSEDGIKDDVALMLLTGCEGLSALYLESMPSLTDELLSNILQNNSLVQLKGLSLLNCSLTIIGLANLVTNCSQLESFEIRTSELTFESAAAIIHDINPLIIVS